VAARTSRQQYPFSIARLVTRQGSYVVQQAEAKATKEAKALTDQKTKVRKETQKATVAVAGRIQEISRSGL
jgi:hypothetical protein